MSDIVIKVEGLGKEYIIGHKKVGDLRNAFGQKLQQLFKGNQTTESFWALKDINFEIKKGEAVGIIGRNGAGKSTLLKILSRITEPTTGRFEINGRVSSLLEVGTGFHPELSGRENIYLNGTILGMKRAEIKSKFDEIIAFSGVEKFIDTPVKHYSSGMKVRLAFSVAAHLEPEILIIDEVLAVGDAEFQKKCLGKMDDVSKNEGRTVIFVSHNLGAVRQLCTKAILLEQGKKILQAPTAKVIEKYTFNKNALQFYEQNDPSNNKKFTVNSVTLANKIGLANTFSHDEEIEIIINFNAKTISTKYNICYSLYNQNNQVIFTTDVPLRNYRTGSRLNVFSSTIPSHTLTSGTYSLMVAIHNPVFGEGAIEYIDNICPFKIYDNGSHFIKYEGIWDVGSVFIDCKWNLK